MQLNKIQITIDNAPKHFGEVVAAKLVHMPLSQGAFIAGGFARCVAHQVLGISDIDIQWYLSPRYKSWDSPRRPSGDVDIFASAKINLDRYEKDTRESCGYFARDAYDNFSGNSYKIQLVTHPKYRYDNVTSCFKSFDIINARYAIVMEDNKYYLAWDESAEKVDREKQLDINDATGPFLASRVLKYLTFKGCQNGITQNGYDKLTEWFARAASGVWPDHYNGRHLSSIKHHVMNMQARGFMKATDLIHFLGKWSIVHREEKYGPTTEIDWAVKSLDKKSSRFGAAQ